MRAMTSTNIDDKSDSNSYSYGSNKKGQFGDTTLTKVFVGGLAWETPLDALRHHFDRFGDILEAVIISDKLTGRSKGYGFVTFKDPEAAKKACEDSTPIINGRRANCNIAALGARRPPRSSSATPPPPQQPPNGGVGNGFRPASAPGHVQWYYPAPTAPFHPHHHHQAIPFYGYSPAYVAGDVNNNHKLSYNGGGPGSYINGQMHYPQMYGGAGHGQAMMGLGINTFMPYYPFYYQHQHQHQQSHQPSMGLPAHMFPPSAAGPITPHPPIISRPTPLSIASPSVCLTVE